MAKVLGAAFRGKVDKLQKYLEAEDPSLIDCPSVDYADEAGTTPLHAACQEGHAACVALLLRVGAIVDKVGAGGISPLIVACENNHAECAKLLIKGKASVHFADAEHGATALHSACQVGSAECVEALVAAKAPLDVTDKAGATPLIIAAYGGHTSCVKLLMAAGADDTKEYEGKLAVELAEELGYNECTRALMESATVDESSMSKEEKMEAARAKLAANPVAGAGAKALAEAAGKMGPDPSETAKAAKASEDEKMRKSFAKKPGEDLLSQLQRGLKENGLAGGDLIDEKRKELDEMTKATEEMEKKKKEAAAKKVAERPKTASEAKARANKLFTAGKVADAAEMYGEALKLAEAEATNPDGSESDSATGGVAGEPPQRAVLHCNLAACRLRQRMWREAIESCDAACDLYQHYTKALYRRAQARRHLMEFEEAMADAKAAYDALCRAGDGKPVGEAGKKTASEIEKFAAALKADYEKHNSEQQRKEREEFGITLGEVEEDKAKSVYYHYASQGEKTQDFMWWIRAELRKVLTGVSFDRDEGFRASNGFHCSKASIAVTEFDPPYEGGMVEAAQTHGALDGTCTIRTYKGRRSLFFDLQIEVPWRGFTNKGQDDERTLGGKTRLWNITHFNELKEWQHQNHRNTGELGPWTDAIAEMLAPAMAARLKLALQEVVGKLMYDRIDPAMFEPPPKPEKPKAASRAWGKGTVDYSKFDNISDDEDEKRIEDVTDNLDLYQDPKNPKPKPSQLEEEQMLQELEQLEQLEQTLQMQVRQGVGGPEAMQQLREVQAVLAQVHGGAHAEAPSRGGYSRSRPPGWQPPL